MWGATPRPCAPSYTRRISIHTPRVGRDGVPFGDDSARGGFQSTRPVWGATMTNDDAEQTAKFQSTRPVWGATVPIYTGLITAVTLYFSRTSFSAVFLLGIFRRKVLCVIRARTEILRLFSRRRCLLQHQSSFSFITWFCTDVLRFSCVFIS